jgi:hypothetical protein
MKPTAISGTPDGLGANGTTSPDTTTKVIYVIGIAAVLYWYYMRNKK